MERKPVERVKKGCKVCGSTDVAWHQSERGKWYLVEVFNDPRDGGAVASYRDFHSAYCKGEKSHIQAQDEINADHAEQQSKRDEAAADRETARIAKEATMTRDFIALGSHQARLDFIAELERKREAHSHNDPTMDYFTDQMRWRAEMEAMDNEISYYEELLADLVEED